MRRMAAVVMAEEEDRSWLSVISSMSVDKLVASHVKRQCDVNGNVDNDVKNIRPNATSSTMGHLLHPPHCNHPPGSHGPPNLACGTIL
jgi:hypothetical protein